MKDNPSGAKMLERTVKVKDQVKSILQEYPQSRGSDMILFWRWLRRYYPEVKISMVTFKSLLRIPTFETARRRAKEIINARRCEYCGAEYLHQIEECEKCGRQTNGTPIYPELQPTERTLCKRFRREEAYRHNYGKGLTLTDFEGD